MDTSGFKSLGSLLGDIMADLESGETGHAPGCRKSNVEVLYEAAQYRYDDYEDKAKVTAGRMPEPPVYMYDFWMK